MKFLILKSSSPTGETFPTRTDSFFFLLIIILLLQTLMDYLAFLGKGRTCNRMIYEEERIRIV